MAVLGAAPSKWPAAPKNVAKPSIARQAQLWARKAGGLPRLANTAKCFSRQIPISMRKGKHSAEHQLVDKSCRWSRVVNGEWVRQQLLCGKRTCPLQSMKHGTVPSSATFWCAASGSLVAQRVGNPRGRISAKNVSVRLAPLCRVVHH